MLQEISKITGFPFNESDPGALVHLRRIERKLPIEVNVNLLDRSFVSAVRKAAAEVDAEGPLPEVVDQPEGPRVLKIKSSPKGTRIKVAAANGVRFSFGPIWNASVIKGKGIALAEANRAKLQHQAEMLGLTAPFPVDGADLAKLVAEKLQAEPLPVEVAS